MQTPTQRCYSPIPNWRGIIFKIGFMFATLGLCGFLLAGMSLVANAQGTQPESSDIGNLIDDLNDIDAMRPIIPLKLTGEQLDKLVGLISGAQANYDRRIKAVTGPALARMADRIRSVKLQTAKGEPIPKDFDALAKEAEKEILDKRKKLDAEIIAAMATDMEKILTPDQIKLAVKLDRDASIKLNKVPANKQLTDEQWFASYVKDAVFTVPRIVPVLKGMKTALDGSAPAK